MIRFEADKCSRLADNAMPICGAGHKDCTMKLIYKNKEAAEFLDMKAICNAFVEKLKEVAQRHAQDHPGSPNEKAVEKKAKEVFG